MKKAIFIFLLLILWIPRIQDQFKWFPLMELSGASDSTPKPEFNFIQWVNGRFQNNYSKYKDESFGFRNFFIRMYNQFDFSFFKKPHSEVTIGKNNYLFQQNYIDEITGSNFIGEDAMRSNVENIRQVQDYLNSKKIFLLTILAPGKTDYYKQYLPSYYLDRMNPQRNYTSILKFSERENIRVLDFNKWFLQMKDTSRYLLFSRQGIHWGYYGMALAADSIVRYIESEKNIRLPKISWTLEFPDNLRGTDYDLGDLLNIYEKLPYDKMTYPRFKIDDDTLIKHPRLLVIGDSFYWTILNEGIFSKVFKDETFFYYCSSVYPKERAASEFTADLNFLKEIEKYDIILLLQSSANYGNPGVNFIQTMTNELTNRKEFRKKGMEKIPMDETLLKRALQISFKSNVTSDSAISILADSLVEDRFEQISKVKIEMRHNHDWMLQLYQKRNLFKKSIDQIMQADAEWILDHK